jgi:predicted nucleotide-binding protein
MTELKPKIFIGSSSSGYNIAEEVKKSLSKVADVYLWKDSGVWDINRSTFDNLLLMSNYFDFGVFVATLDDLTVSNGNLVIEPRDNVILEISLFLGAIGKNKAFLLVEEGIKLPSDFNGIFMPCFSSDDFHSIKACCDEFITKIEEHYHLGHLSLYPTTALAVGYYKNFLSGLVDSVQKSMPIQIKDVVYNDFKIKVVIPSDLKGMIRQKADLFYKRHGLVENAIKTQFRNHPAWFCFDPKSAPLALIFDMPSTLTGLDVAIELNLQKGFIGRTKLQEIIEQRELNNFRRVLQIMIEENPYAQAFIELIDEF